MLCTAYEIQKDKLLIWYALNESGVKKNARINAGI
jgi:hypothetical protein